jgi:hypothetical protein
MREKVTFGGSRCKRVATLFIVGPAECSKRSLKVFCCDESDCQGFTDTKLTLDKIFKGLEAQKFPYRYDENHKVLEFKNKDEKYPVNIYFKDHASGLLAYQAGQFKEGMKMGGMKLYPDAEIAYNPCVLLKRMTRK